MRARREETRESERRHERGFGPRGPFDSAERIAIEHETPREFSGAANPRLCSRRLVRVRLLYFAALKDLTGLAEEWLELEDATSVAEVVARLPQVRPVLAGKLSSVRIALNETFAAPSDHVNEGDTLALIPPVSGG